MSLQVWLPLNDGTLRQQGLSSVVPSGTAFTSNASGKMGQCITTTSGGVLDLGYNGNQINTGSISFGGWFRFNKTAIGNIINPRTYNSTYPCATGNFIGNTSYGGIGLVWTSNNMNTSPPFASMSVFGNIRTSTVNRNTSGYTIPFDTWIHIFLTFDKSTGNLTLWINGSAFSTTTFSSFNDARSYPLGINYHGVYGGNGPGLNIPFDCNDIRIYNHCLSNAEIKELSRGLVCHYTFGDKYLESTVNWLSDRGMSSYGSYGFGSQGTIATTTEIAPPIAGKEVGLITSKRTTTSNDAVEIATSMGSSAMNQGDTFTVSAYVKGKGNTVGKRCHIHLYNTNGTNTQSTGKDYTFTNEWQRIDYTLTWNNATPSNNSLNCYVVGYIAGGEQFYVSCIQVEHKNHSTPFVGTERITTTVYDSSGFTNNGTISGDLTINSIKPKYGSCIYIPAAATISHERCLDNTNQEWTCTAWVKPDVAGNYQNLNNFNSNNRLYHGTYPLLYLNSGSNDYYRYGNKAIPAGEWTHVAFVFKNSTGQRDIYLNGVLQNGSGPNLTSTPSGIPTTVVLAGGNYAGYLSDYREYATALSADDIKSLYQNEAAFDDQGNILGPIR